MHRKNRKTLHRTLLRVERGVQHLFGNRKGVSVVISTVVLSAGVLALGIAVLYWAYSWGSIANLQYSKSVANSSYAVSERVGFEYISYSGSSRTLTVNIINWGTASTVDVVSVHIFDNARRPLGSYSNPLLLKIGTTNSAISSLNITDEAYFQINPLPPLASNSLYYIRVVTERGRTFDSSFVTT